MSWADAIRQLQIDNPNFQERILQHNGTLKLANGDPIPFSDLFCLDDETGEDLLLGLTEQELLHAEAIAFGRIADEQRIQSLRNLSKSDALIYYRNAKIVANGNLNALGAIYTKAREYEARNEDLAALIATNRALYEFIEGRALNLTNNQDKAIYLFNLFEPALILAAIEDI